MSLNQGAVVVAVEDAVAAEDIKAAAAVVATAATIITTTIPIKETTREDPLKAAEDITIIKGPHSTTTIRGIRTRVDTKPIKASTSIKDPLKAKAAEEESVSTPEGGTISITLKWVLGPMRVPIAR